MAQKIMASAQALGLNWQKLDKFIHMDTCRTNCHRCTYGCPYGAKWTARNPLEAAIEQGAQLISEAKVKKVITHNGQAVAI